MLGDREGETQEAFTNALKTFASKRQQLCEYKFGASTSLEWSGRIIVACNADVRSIQIIPTFSTSLNNKMLLLYPKRTKILSPSNATTMFSELLPFATYLYNHSIPKEYVDTVDNRFGVVGYQNIELYNKSKQDKSKSRIEEILQMFMLRLYELHGGNPISTKFSISTLYINICNDDYLKPLLQKTGGAYFSKQVRGLIEDMEEGKIKPRWIRLKGLQGLDFDLQALCDSMSEEDKDYLRYVRQS
jgi:hypothetical protein